VPAYYFPGDFEGRTGFGWGDLGVACRRVRAGRVVSISPYGSLTFNFDIIKHMLADFPCPAVGSVPNAASGDLKIPIERKGLAGACVRCRGDAPRAASSDDVTVEAWTAGSVGRRPAHNNNNDDSGPVRSCVPHYSVVRSDLPPD